ncbi:MFS transporter [Nonomuraea sp. NPDC050663]|uniref:MFS transporter n=1 Tax=Nonomuraea sp. NPDC050663 TaxID=3364370 RepID=UPI0037A99AC7
MIRPYQRLLVKNVQFRRSWSASALSMLGTRTLSVTYPLLGYSLTDSATWTAVVVFAATVPGLFCYVPAGMLIDRLGPVRVMIRSEAVRGAVVMVLFCVVWTAPFDRQWIMWVLLGGAFLEGCLSVVSSLSETALIPAVTAGRRDVVTGLALHETTAHAVVLAGRPLAGALHGLHHSVSFVMNAVAFIGSSRLLRRVSRESPEPTATSRASSDGRMRLGFTELWANLPLRTATLLTAVINLFVQSLIVVFISYQSARGLHTATIGIILAMSGVGGVLGALLAPLQRLRSDSVTLLAHLWVCGLALALIPSFGLAPWTFAVALFMIGTAGGLSNVTVRRLMSHVPGRVISVSRLGSYSTIAFGPVLATLLYEFTDPGITIIVMAATTGVLAVMMTTVRRLRECLIH